MAGNVKCAKCGITPRDDSSLTFHRFPLPSKHGPLKVQVWAKFCYPNDDWTSNESLQKLYAQHKMLCGNHFDNSSFTSSDRKRLNKFAIPTEAQTILAQLKDKQCSLREAQQTKPKSTVEIRVTASTSKNIVSIDDSNIHSHCHPESTVLTKCPTAQHYFIIKSVPEFKMPKRKRSEKDNFESFKKKLKKPKRELDKSRKRKRRTSSSSASSREASPLQVSEEYGPDIHEELATRFKHITTYGLESAHRKGLLAKYKIPSNCTHIDAPVLNAEIKAALPKAKLKRDKSIELRQKNLSTAISCLASVMTEQFASTETNQDMLKKLMDMAQLLCDIQHTDSKTRRNFAMCSVKKDMKEHLSYTKIDMHLFGENLSEALESAKVVIKSGVDLKIKKKNSKKSAATPRNSKTQAAKTGSLKRAGS